MTSASLARDDAMMASLYAGWVAAIAHDPRRWKFPESTASFLQWRIATLAADMVQTGATGMEVAA